MPETEVKIIGGPARDAMISSLSRWLENKPAYMLIAVKTSRVPRLSFSAEISRIGPESGDHRYENWILTLIDEGSNIGAQKLEVYYNSSKRTGIVRPIPC